MRSCRSKVSRRESNYIVMSAVIVCLTDNLKKADVVGVSHSCCPVVATTALLFFPDTES